MKANRSTNYLINPLIPPPHKRPKCQHRGCKKPVAISTTYKDGTPYYRASGLCGVHHQKSLAKKHGVKHAGEITAQRQGYKSLSDYRNSTHPYRQYRKDYCENQDGRLGYRCRVKIRVPLQLEVDHKNGNPNDNRPRNLQTLCCMCHKYKTYINKDRLTPGRKKLGIKQR
jgi:hypothetical protein